jgi:EmrB/QacA subfamily drug resistance transporter
VRHRLGRREADAVSTRQVDTSSHARALSEQTRYAWRVLSVTSLGNLLTGLNASTLDVGLPAVSRHFDATASQASWFLLSYMLVNTVLILLFGRLADLLGRRLLYVAGLGVFTAASLGCGLAPNPTWLIALRALQAVGAAAIITNTTAQLVDAFPRPLVGLALGLNVTVISAAKVAGPVVGGALVTTLGWRWVFLFNVPVGIVGLIWAMVILRSAPIADPDASFDVLGAALSVLWLAGVVIALSQGSSDGWLTAPVITSIAVATVSFPLFLIVQSRRRDALVDLALFHDKERAMAFLATFLISIAQLALVLLVSLFLQAAQGLDGFSAGVRVMPLALGMMIAAPVAGRLAARVPARVLSTLGALLVAAGLLALVIRLSPTSGYMFIGGALLAVGVGNGFFLPSNTSTIMASVGPQARGVANGVRSMLQNTGGLVSTAMALAIVTSPLNPIEKRAAYAGTLSRLPSRDLSDLVGGYRVALLVLFALCLVGAAASMLRGDVRRTVGVLADPGL